MNIQQLNLKGLTSSSSNICSTLKQLSQNSLAEASKILDQQTVAQLQQKYQQLQNSQQKHIEFLQAFICFLIDNIDSLLTKDKSLVSSSARQIIREDYQALQQAIQRSQAQIRKHIRVQHQFKIYLDGLQDQIQELKKKTAILDLKNHHLTQTLRSVEKQKKHLMQKLQKFEQQKLKPSHSNDLFALSRAYKDVYVSWKYTGNKSKKIIDKIHDRTKLSNKRSVSKKLDIEKSSQANLATSISKKVAHPRNISNKKDSLKQLTKTVQMKESRLQKRKENPTSKYNTSLTEERQYKIYRSNSVCN